MKINIQNLIDDERCKNDVHRMASILRTGVVGKKQEVELEKEVECDEVSVVAGQ